LRGFRVNERFECEKPAASGNNGISAVLVLADDKEMQQPVRGDGRGEIGSALAGAGLPDVAVPGEQLFVGDGRGRHVVLLV